MMLEDTHDITKEFNVKGEFGVQYNPKGKEEESPKQFKVPNVIVDIGEDEVAKLVASGLGGTRFNALALGDSGDAATDAQTELLSEITGNGGARAAASIGQGTNSNEVKFEYTWTFSGSLAVREAGLFNSAASTSGEMLARQSFNVINVVSDDELTIIYTLTCGSAR